LGRGGGRREDNKRKKGIEKTERGKKRGEGKETSPKKAPIHISGYATEKGKKKSNENGKDGNEMKLKEEVEERASELGKVASWR